MKSTRKSVKRSLLVSAAALVLSIAMLIGTTFAWFTDSVTSGVNKIQAGNLDVDLEMNTGTSESPNWVSAEGKTIPFLVNGQIPAEGTQILWEPGCTYQMAKLRVVNNGNLALKYKVIINKDSTSALNEVLEWKIAEGDKGYADATAFNEGTEYRLGTGDSNKQKEFTIYAHMQETAGNEYKEKTLENVSVTIMATQDTVEQDSFNNQYDKDALYPDIAFKAVSSSEELNDLLANPVDAAGNKTDKIVADLAEGTYTLPTIAGNKTVTISGTQDTVLDMTKSGIIGAQNAGLDLTIDGVKVSFAPKVDYKGITHSYKVTYKNCTIEGKQFLYADFVEFENCTFKNSSDYCIWTYGAKNVSFKDCTFETGGKAILVYNEKRNENFTANIRVDGCTFNDDGTLSGGKAAIETGSVNPNVEASSRYTITVTNTTVSGFDINSEGINTGSTLWGNKNSLNPNYLSVTIDGVKKY